MSTATTVRTRRYPRRLRRRAIRQMTPVAREFLSRYLAGDSVSALSRRFGWHPLEILAAKRNFYHEHHISPSTSHETASLPAGTRGPGR